MNNKLKDFNKRLQGFKKKNLNKNNLKKNKNLKDINIVFKSGIELVSPVIVAVFIGIFLDNYFQSKPVFLIIFLILGFSAGIINVFRAVKRLGFEVGFKKKKMINCNI